MRFIYFAFVLALFSTSLAAQEKQEKKDVATLSSVTLLINGQPIKGKLLETDGKYFVAVEDLAQSLRGTIAYDDGQIALTISKLPFVAAQQPLSQSSSATAQATTSPAPPITAQPLETGSIKGTLTYFFDFHSGTKPDSGAKVWLVKGHAELPASQNFMATSTAVGTTANPQQYSALQYSTTDANGNFEMPDVPAGQYTLILQSAHTKWTLNEKRNFFGRGNGHNPRDSNGRVDFLDVNVKPGDTAEASKDFGPNVE